MKRRRISFWATLVLLAFAGGLFIKTSRAGYETAEYEVAKKDGKFEVRNYKAHVLISVPMKNKGRDDSFGRLFKYISGKNEGEVKIAMTTPVFMPAAGDGEPAEMQFVLPTKVVESGVPEPTDPSLRLTKRNGGKYAVIRYSGGSEAAARKTRLAELREWMNAEGLEAEGSPLYAGYDPPWTPGPLRRNEVMLRIK